MSIGAWVVVGLIAGVLANKLLIRTGDGLLRDLGLGVAGAAVGGFTFRILTTGAGGLSFAGVLVTLAGAAAALVVFHRYLPRTADPKRVRRAAAK
jgi:uncharacterized membrane protein YeaQ/YmgE (transglycosylase-associated protein family)